jgi:BlaI family transcriptional regulator, penicillinase repressor
MKKTSIPKPTEAELAILRVLWERGPSTVRQVHDVAAVDRPIGYTTTLKLLQIMTDKGLVIREERDRIHIYQAAHGEEQMQRRLVGDLLDRAFRGSAAKLVMQALATKPASAGELRELRKLIDTYAQKEKERAGNNNKR